MSYHCNTCAHAALPSVAEPCLSCTGVAPGSNWQPMTAPGPAATGTEARVIEDIARRQALGIAKYGTTVAENPLALRQWLQHAYEEHLDAAVYLRRAIEELDAKP